MEYTYHWKDQEGVDHFTRDREEADRAMHNGYFIQLIPNGRVAG